MFFLAQERDILRDILDDCPLLKAVVKNLFNGCERFVRCNIGPVLSNLIDMTFNFGFLYLDKNP